MEDIENILCEVTQTKEHSWYVSTERLIFALNFTMSMIQPTDTMDLRRKGDQSMAASVLH